MCEDTDFKLRNLVHNANDEDRCPQTIKSEDDTNNLSDYEPPILEITVPPIMNKAEAEDQNGISKIVNVDKTEENLKIKQKSRKGEKPLTCSVCGESFAHTAGLVTHKRKHSGQTPYHCSLCPRSFRTPGHLQYHTRSHTGEKKFECETCDRAFIMKSDLKQHQRVHSGDKPHVCCTCGLRLARASHLKRHMATHGHGEKDAAEVGKEEENCCS
ncbi:hypothetical protein JYU34_014139 [Plutella xylostella]|uniref:C2H2-type domain-containing protein n=1 Tax=Plutella xylostella TaxID=51655 RepID=A0ABQ7Q7X6_PLUXY|nr:hypothetical protein JYU34_014139 [Plutella xylostella]